MGTPIPKEHCASCWDGGHDGGFCMIDACGCHKSYQPTFEEEAQAYKDVLKQFDFVGVEMRFPVGPGVFAIISAEDLLRAIKFKRV